MKYFLVSIALIFFTAKCGENSHLSLDNLTPLIQDNGSPSVNLDISAGITQNVSINLTGTCSPDGSTVSIASPDMTPSPVSSICSGGSFVMATAVVFDTAGPNGQNPVIATTITSSDGGTAQDSDTTNIVVPSTPTVDLDVSAGLAQNVSTNLAGTCSPDGATVDIASPDMTPSPVSGLCNGGSFVMATPVVFDAAGPNGQNPVIDTTLTSSDGGTAQDSDTINIMLPPPPAVDLVVSAGLTQNTPTNLSGTCTPGGATVSIASPDMTPSPVSGTCDSSGSFMIATPVVFDATGPNGQSPILSTTLTSSDGSTAQDSDTLNFSPIARITSALQADGSSNLGIVLTNSDESALNANDGTALVAGDTVTITVRDNATNTAIETLTGDYGQPLTGYATDAAVATNSIQSYITTPGDDVTNGATLAFDKLAWAKATGNVGVNKGLELKIDIAATDSSAGTTSLADSTTIEKGFLKLGGSLTLSSTIGSQNSPYNCPSNVRFISGGSLSPLADASTAETSEDGTTWVPKTPILVGGIVNFCADAQPGPVNSTWGRIVLAEPSYAVGAFGGITYIAFQKLETAAGSNFYAVRSFIISDSTTTLDVTNTLVDIEAQTRTINLNGTTFSNMYIEASPGAGLPTTATFNPPFDNNVNSTITTTETHDFNGGEGVYHVRTELGGGPHSSEQNMYLLLMSF